MQATTKQDKLDTPKNLEATAKRFREVTRCITSKIREALKFLKEYDSLKAKLESGGALPRSLPLVYASEEANHKSFLLYLSDEEFQVIRKLCKLTSKYGQQ